MNPNAVAGVLFALGAVILWGLFPIYWKQLVDLDPLEVLAHRVVWSVPFIGLVVVATRRWPTLYAMVRQPARLGVLVLTALLISTNWAAYIWAMGVNKVVEASMGYFLTPLLNVVIGMALFRERLHPVQWLAVAIAAAGVVYLFMAKDVAPWIALVLAVSFAAYGALRKGAVHDSITGLLVETVLVAPLAMAYILLIAGPRGGGFLDLSPQTDWLLIGSGVATATPLLLFVAGARRLHYSTIGVLFYLAPSIQFLLGVFVYREPLVFADMVAFSCIWIALALFAGHGYVASRRRSPQ